MRCPDCVDLAHCFHPWRECELKTLRLLDVLQAKQKRNEELEMERDLRDSRRVVSEAKKK